MKQLHRWKLYFDKDLEESWLNQLAQQGWGMSSFCLGRYTFEPIEPGEYIYRVDLLPSMQAPDFPCLRASSMQYSISARP